MELLLSKFRNTWFLCILLACVAAASCSIKSAIDQLLTLMLKLSNSHALKTIGKPLPIATRLSTFLQDGDGTAKKCQMKKRIFVFVCLLKWKTKTIFEKSIKSSITYQKHSEIQKIVGTLNVNFPFIWYNWLICNWAAAIFIQKLAVGYNDPRW